MRVAKYSANGNDFVIFDSNDKIDRSSLAKILCDRHNGVGADGLIVIVPNEKYDFEWQFYNNDGSKADMCGNGSRACAHYAYKNGLADKNMKFLTNAGEIEANIFEEDVVEVRLTKPKMVSKKFSENGYEWYFFDTGVPHLVTVVDCLEKFDVDIAKKMRERYNANVNFVVIQKDILYVRTYERGVEAETQACGTGMAACFCVANKINNKLIDVKVFPKNKGEVFFRFVNGDIYFKGEVKHTFTAEIEKDLNENIL
ncbi:MAG: diaminopimelate epimerase [Campylobacteraceae bacterium]|jgi:diaminopimelate epimerase|nr:diaminopimelate epimerase [Campylobacteraceae bacterium]